VHTPLSRILLAATFFIVLIVCFLIGEWGFGNMVSTRAENTEIADLAVDLAPSDPQTHFAAAVTYDKTFLAADQSRSLSEYEAAVALSPHNYLLWLEYGKALSRSGDLDNAETAVRKAADLAPNYSSVAWALGNLLVRKGSEAQGFAEIRRAVEGDGNLAAPAATLAYQLLDGDVSKINGQTGSSPEMTAALAIILARDKRFDEAFAAWAQMPSSAMNERIRVNGRTLINVLIAAHHYRQALQVDASVEPAVTSNADKVTDGGFEEDIRLENPRPFEWRMTPGSQPQLLQSTSQPHGGARSLVLRFNSNDGASLRQVGQTVVVEPGGKYLLKGFYRSDLKTSSQPVWQIAASGNVISEIPLSSPADEWREFRGSFTVPKDVDGIEIRSLIKGCGSAICPISGSLWLDDITLARD